MRKIFILFGVLILFFLCGCYGSMESYKASQRQYGVSVLQSISPNGLLFSESAGLNWWKGSYCGRPVLIHAVDMDKYVSVSFQFID